MDPEKIISQQSNEDAYKTKFDAWLHRSGKIFSYTFWRTQIKKHIFWSVQGHNEDGAAWVTTQYFGPPEEAGKFRQIAVLTHPMDPKIGMSYCSSCEEGQNRIIISKIITQCFKNECNSFDFEFKIVKTRRKIHRTF